jgi:hypothetical protein
MKGSIRIFTSLSNTTSMKQGYASVCGENPPRSKKNLESMKIQAYNPNNKEKSYAYTGSGR